MPGFGQQLDTLERWRRLPALERLDDAGVALTFDDGPDPDATPGGARRARRSRRAGNVLPRRRAGRGAPGARARDRRARARGRPPRPPSRRARRAGRRGGGLRVGGRARASRGRGGGDALPAALRSLQRRLVRGMHAARADAGLLVGLGLRLGADPGGRDRRPRDPRPRARGDPAAARLAPLRLPRQRHAHGRGAARDPRPPHASAGWRRSRFRASRPRAAASELAELLRHVLERSAASRRWPATGRRPPAARPRRGAWRCGRRACGPPRPGWTAVSARRGSSVTPTPAATSAWAAVVSSTSKATRGSKPASRQARCMIRRQPPAVAGGDPGLLGQVGQRHPAALGERVPAGQDRLVGVVEQVESARGRRRAGRARPRGRRRARGRRRRHAGARRPRRARPPASTARRGGGARGTRPPRAVPASRRRSGTRSAAGARRAGPASAASSSSAESMRARIASAWPTSARPASVRRTPRRPRSTSWVPVSRSSAATCCDIADCVKLSASAAAEKDPHAATSRRTRIRRTSSIRAAYRARLDVFIWTDGCRSAILDAGCRDARGCCSACCPPSGAAPTCSSRSRSRTTCRPR